MKKTLAILALALFIGGISAPVIASNSNALTLISLQEEDPKKKATEKEGEKKATTTKEATKSADCSHEKKSADCSHETKSESASEKKGGDCSK